MSDSNGDASASASAQQLEEEKPQNDMITPESFLNIREITEPKELSSLVSLWDRMFTSMGKNLKDNLENLLSLAKQATTSDGEQLLQQEIDKTDNEILYNILRALHLKNHLKELDAEVTYVEKPRKVFVKATEEDILHSKLILQNFLGYLEEHGVEKFAQYINQVSLRLVSTVHPNETERTTNLRHYTSILEKYTAWRKDLESLVHLSHRAPEYRIRRESLNQLRRAIKAEIEGVWQSDQMRHGPIPVQSEAARILERYKVIFEAYPSFVKFVKHLVAEAFWLYQASLKCNDPEWCKTFSQFHKQGASREDTLQAIKKTFGTLGIILHPPRITHPIITFSTWKGGDRDGNPYVVASFTNLTFVDQKLFVLQHWVEFARKLVDKLTPSTKYGYISISAELEKSINSDKKAFPYITNIKPWEPYRAKTRYILEKLENTLNRVIEVKKQAGETTKPLLGQTLPGPSGYNTAAELKHDISLLYESMLQCGGKSQARSLLQDFQILVETFGLHMTAIDFRQTSEKNADAMCEYLSCAAKEYPYLIPQITSANWKKLPESDRIQILLDLLLSDIEFDPWIINQLSKISRDTFETFMIFADAANAELDSIGKFIISMCQNTSDILVVLFLMKLVGMLVVQNKRISRCPFDVTGLFETIDDLQKAPAIIKQLLSLPLIRNYIIEHRAGQLTVMLGYSDSVRDGSALASDSQVISTTLQLKALEEELNRNAAPNQQIHLIFYRGRGDTIPRGFGGSITKAIASQLIASPTEDHTEQNRYLRCYASISSAIDHFHSVYSAHLSTLLTSPPALTMNYQNYFNFFARYSYIKWITLVRSGPNCNGDTYFKILGRYGILPHLPKSFFASRPVARGGVHYNIDTIRAIPFTMHLVQLREFTNAYYGSGTAFELGSKALDDPQSTAISLLKYHEKHRGTAALKDEFKHNQGSLALVVRTILNVEDETKLDEILSKIDRSTPNALEGVLDSYHDASAAVESVASLLLDIKQRNCKAIDVLREMYAKYPPFRYSIENKETALLIRNKRIVDDYTKGVSAEEKAVLDDTEAEAQLTKKWILSINQQTELVSKTLTTDFNSPELLLLHKIQSKFLHQYMDLSQHIGTKDAKVKHSQLMRLERNIQMSILALSEALGFAG